MIILSKNTVSATAAANTTIGTLTLLDSSRTARSANWSLTPSAANYFIVAGGVLSTLRASIPAGFYAIKVRANATFRCFKSKGAVRHPGIVMLVRFLFRPARWFWYVADEQAGPFATYDEAVQHQREFQR